MSILKTLMKIMNNVSNHTPEYASTTSLRDLQALSPYDPCRLPLTLCLSPSKMVYRKVFQTFQTVKHFGQIKFLSKVYWC